MHELWIPYPANRKTGPIPTLYIGSTVDETRASCIKAGCPLLPVGAGGPAGPSDVRCYAWSGTPRIALSMAQKRRASGGDATLTRALKLRSPNARAARLGAIGDPLALGQSRLSVIDRMVRRAGLALLSYTHGWRRALWMRRYALASCETLAIADVAVKRGFRATVILEDTFAGKNTRTPAGRLVVVCPAQRSKMTCNDCRLCDPQTRGPIVGFIEHGPGSQARKGGK